MLFDRWCSTAYRTSPHFRLRQFLGLRYSLSLSSSEYRLYLGCLSALSRISVELLCVLYSERGISLCRQLRPQRAHIHYFRVPEFESLQSPRNPSPFVWQRITFFRHLLQRSQNLPYVTLIFGFCQILRSNFDDSRQKSKNDKEVDHGTCWTMDLGTSAFWSSHL